MIINADARDVLSAWPTATVDLCVTDPPYPVISGGNGQPDRPTGILEANDGKIFAHNDTPLVSYVDDLYRVMKPVSHLYVFTNLLNLWSFRDTLVGAGFKIHNLLVWHKTNATPNRWFMKNAEYIIFARKGPARTIYTTGEKTVLHGPSVRDRSHPTEKPQWLLSKLIEASSKPGELVFDPFAGSGSTIKTATRMGRRGVGVEIDEQYISAA